MAMSFRFLIVAFLLAGLNACSFPPKIYRMDVRQGNHLEEAMIKGLKVGMTKEQVQELCGTPALTRFFERDRWDYYYYLKPGNGKPIEHCQFSVWFKGNRVVRIDR